MHLLQLVANAGEISGNGTGLNVVRHVDNEVAQGFLCGLIREAVQLTKGEIRLMMRMISRACGAIEGKTECARVLHENTRPSMAPKGVAGTKGRALTSLGIPLR